MKRLNTLQLKQISRHKHIIISVLLVAALTTITGGVLLNSHQSDASANPADFDASDIMSDAVMANQGAMTEAQIQAFLDNKNTCKTNPKDPSVLTNRNSTYGYLISSNGFKYQYHLKNGQFICLADQKFGGESAAHIIYRAAQDYHVNPQVLIVLLQKEQSLITDNWPNYNKQYATATGYGCPDSGPNHSANCNANYYGFKNQVRKAASLFHTVLTGGWSNYTVGRNKILYNPNPACGSSWVNIKNRATAALYRYTPYQPNSATLRAARGQTVPCGAYGNLNFWYFFTDWFGSTHDNLFKVKGGNTIYLSMGNTYYPIPSPEIYNAYGFNGSRVATVSQSYRDSMQQGPVLNRIVRFGGSYTVYLVDNGKYYPIPNWDSIQQYGFQTKIQTDFNDSNVQNLLKPGNTLTNLAREPSGGIYYVNSGKKHVFPDSETYHKLAPTVSSDGTLSVNNFSKNFVDSIPSSGPMLLSGTAVKAKDSAAIYLYDNEKLRPFTPASWDAWGHGLDFTLPKSADLTLLGVGNNAPILVSQNNNNYLVSGGEKHLFTSAGQAKWGLSNGSFQTITPESLNRLATGDKISASTLPRSPSGAVYIINNGKKMAIQSVNDLRALGYSWSQVTTLDTSAINLLSNDSPAKAFAPGELIRLPSGGVYWIGPNFTRHGITSMASFNAFGFSWNNVRNYSSDALDGYPNTNLQQIVRSSDGAYYLADLGALHHIGPSAYSSSQYDLASKQYSSVTNDMVKGLKTSNDLTQFIKYKPKATVYMVVNGKKHGFSSSTSFYNHGGSWDKVTYVSKGFLNSIPSGSTY